jgi:periplasmic divalent cation tolerance protein
MADFVQVQTTTERYEEADRIAGALVERRLAACVQVLGPIQSTYRWQEEVERAEEWLCLIKTRRDAYHAVESAVAELHPYETPEIVAVPIEGGSRAYLGWLSEQVGEED